MRVLNTETLKFVEIADSSLGEEEQKYAILSHKWLPDLNDEVSFADINESKDVSAKKGFQKFKRFCDLAAELGYDYGWSDTCCINKENSSELNESINSMYRWYQTSDVCIAYLGDVPYKPLIESEWFERGWTLQELIGPTALSFYDSSWKHIGSKKGLLKELSMKTAIPEDVLSHAAEPSSCSIAQRLSWAATRVTTRVEDRAYSLLGILGVNMPSIYGEREKAFERLQRTLIRESKDESLFVWLMGVEDPNRRYAGLLAPSPSAFAHCNDIVPTPGSTGFSETNGELSIRLRTFPHSMEVDTAVLNCTKGSRPDHRIVILIRRLDGEDEYIRVNQSFRGGTRLNPPSTFANSTFRQIHVSIAPVAPPPDIFYGFWLRTLAPPGHASCTTTALSKGRQLEKDKICLDEEDSGTAGIVSFEPVAEGGRKSARPGWSYLRWIKLGFDRDFNPMLLLAGGDWVHSGVPMRKLVALSETSTTARHKLFNDSWMTDKGSVPSRKTGWPAGFSVLRVDKRKGLRGSIDALNLGIAVELCPTTFPTTTCQKDTRESLMQTWVIDITDTGGSSPEKDMLLWEMGFWSRRSLTIPCEVFCPWLNLEKREQIYRRRGGKNARTVLTASNLGEMES